ncbi:nucleoside hydrolase [Marisediminicola sp. LYQ134]|uniref:nucleoside hydrolase n=1 Tax=Marisediminicola sp. LYQ134 TaxID=3391061 RepID=UPI003983A898
MRVILDCDTKNEIDDQLAIAYALGSPELDVLGVVSVQNTTASGVASVDVYTAEARLVADLCGRPDLPCLPGARAPMETPSTPVGSAGLDFIVEHAQIAPLTLLATGPITDVASLVLQRPDLVERVHVVWAGAFPDEATWNRFRLGELNARADIAAWRALYSSDIRLTLLPGWPAIARVAVPWRDYSAQLRDLGGELSEFLATIIEEYSASRSSWWLGSEEAQRHKILWDVVNVAILRNPAWVTLEHRDLPTLDAAGAPDYSRPARSADVCVDVDERAIIDDLWTVLESFATGRSPVVGPANG